MILHNMDISVTVLILTWFVIRFEVLTGVSMRGTVFCDVISCSMAEIYWNLQCIVRAGILNCWQTEVLTVCDI
jgi:hypothetical protein